ncbi:rhamnosyl/mannosyltransferase [Ectothiorhodospira mobilis]|uniref:Rhamnosyl/mannosyltransferase n=1 Tax=Ectothiorhodospira mobilis TaxID=195064 RepID=A0A1I4SIW2_ECTMO|nr:glycosyltransferase [Ectothiorhodospira mobilis]SFM64291.1 rhamnosyl/mannosyltransferase [Ectothiorhodospira mobilis]
MRVLHVFKTYFPETQGGLEEVIRQICRHTRPLGVESRVLTLARRPHPACVQLPEAEVYRHRRWAEIASCGLSPAFPASLRRHAAWADVIHYHFPWPLADLAHLIHAPAAPALITYHADILRRSPLLAPYRPVMHRFLSRLDAIVATSEAYARTSPVLRRHAGRVHIIPIGLDDGPAPIPDPQRLQSLRERVGEGFFLFIGVLRYYKGLHILLQALHRMDRTHGGGPRVVIAGSGPMAPALHRQARTLGLDRVTFLGSVSDADKIALLQLSRGIIFPSHLRAEAFGVTLLEGARQGRPLISTELGTGTSFVNAHGESGLVVPPGDPAALAGAMQRLEADPQLTRRLGLGARARYERLFTGPRMARGYVDLYHRLCAAPRGEGP